MRTGYYTATTARGVEFHGETLEDSEIEVLSPIDFLDELGNLTDDQEIFTFLDLNAAKVYDEIDIIYGIRS